MFKRIIKIVAIVLACAIAGLGIMIGIMFLRGEFKEPYVEPSSIYFDIPDHTLNVTYYANNKTYNGQDASNIYSFELKATPANVTEKLCFMNIEWGAELIEFCDAFGEPLDNASLQSQIKIDEKIYFKIKPNFDNTPSNYETSKNKGEVKLNFITNDNLRITDLKIKIDRQVSSVSLMDFNNTQNNNHYNGVFNYEKQEYKVVTLSNKPDNWKGYYIYDLENQTYVPVADDAEFDVDVVYYNVVENKTLTLEVESYTKKSAGSDGSDGYELKPIFAPQYSNNPLYDLDPKRCEIFIRNTTNNLDVYENIKTTSWDIIKEVDGKYYFCADQAGEYQLKIVTYPTYKNQKQFDEELGSEGLEAELNGNKYSVTRDVVIKVKDSGVQTVLFNDDNTTLNFDLNLFEENKLIVNNPSAISSVTNLNIYMKNGYDYITTRYNQIKFFEHSDFEIGKINLTNADGSKKIVLGNGVATLVGFEGKSGAYSYTISIVNGNEVLIKIDIDNDNNINIRFSGIVGQAEGLYILSYLNLTSNMAEISTNWICNNKLVLLQHTKILGEQGVTDSYKLGTIKTGSYLVFYNSSLGNINKHFEISSSGFGMDKIFTVKPLLQLSEVQLHCFVVNEDGSYASTVQYARVAMVVAPTSLSANKNAELKMKYYTDNEELKVITSSIDVNNFVEINSGSYKFPLMFVKADNPKVHTINQIFYIKDGVRYCLVGKIDEQGKFVNQIIPKNNTIGEENIYVAILKYDYGVKNANELVQKLIGELANQTVIVPEFYVDNNLLYVGSEIEISGEICIITDVKYFSDEINSVEISYYKKSDETKNIITQTISNENLFYNIVNSEKYGVYEFYNRESDVISINIHYVDKIDENDSYNEFSFSVKSYKNEGEQIVEGENDLHVKENTTSKTEFADNLYIDVTVNGDFANTDVLKLIADYDDVAGSKGLNKYYYLSIYQYDNNSNVYLSGNVLLDSQQENKYSINNTTLSKYFKIDDIVFNSDAENNLIRIYFSILSDSNDTFGGYTFKFEFKYDNGSATGNSAMSVPIIIDSTAVTGYQWTVSSIDPETHEPVTHNLSFADYYLVYEIEWSVELSCLVYKPYLIYTDKYEDYLSGEDITNYIIELTEDSIDSLIDDEIITIDNNTSKFITALPKDFETSEFDFLTTVSNDVLSITENSLIINKLGSSKIILTNSTKTNVTSEINVRVISKSIELISIDSKELSANEIDLSNEAHGSGNIFDFYQENTNLFNQTVNGTPIVSFDITGLTTGYNAVSNGYGIDIVDINNNDEVAISLSYVDGKWKLIRQPNYVLNILSFSLTAKTIISNATVRISYLSPVNIEKNANNDMINLEVLNYYEGTILKLTSQKDDNSANTLYKLTDNTSNGNTTFKAQYYSYRTLTEETAWANNKYYKLDSGEYVLLTEQPDDFVSDYSKYYVEDWIDFEGSLNSFAISLTPTNTAGLKIDETYNCRIYFNQNKYSSFRLKKIENVLVEKSIENGDENSLENPYALLWNDNQNSNPKISLDSVIKLYKLNEGEIYTSYNNAQKVEIENLNFYLNSDSKNYEGILRCEDGDLMIDWIRYTGSHTYNAEISIAYGEKTRVENYFVNVNSNYDINLKKGLEKIGAYSSTSINVDEYFEITGGDINNISGIHSIVAKDIDQNVDIALSYNFDKTTKLLTLNYNGAIGGIKYLEAVFEINQKINSKPTDWDSVKYYKLSAGDYIQATESDWGTTDIYSKTYLLSSSENYTIEINSYKLKVSDNKLVAGKDTDFTNLLDTIEWNYVESVELSFNDNKIISSGSNLISKNSNNFKIRAAMLGYDYSINIYMKLNYYVYTLLNTKPLDWDTTFANYFLFDNGYQAVQSSIGWVDGKIYARQVYNTPFEYIQEFKVYNPTYLKVDYSFNDLTLNTTGVAIYNLTAEEIRLDEQQNYDIALTGETIDVTNKAKTYIINTEENGADTLDQNRTLSKVELVGLINLYNDTEYDNDKIVINGNKITFGNFNLIGYAIFKLTDDQNASCYYVVRLTLIQMSSAEDYRSVLNNNIRATGNKTIVVDSDITIEDIISNNDIQAISGVNEFPVLVDNDIYYYLVEKSEVENAKVIFEGQPNIAYGDKINGLVIKPSLNQATMKVAVVVKTTNGVVHLCNFDLVIKPNIQVTANSPVEVIDVNNSKYSLTVKYEYGSSQNEYNLSNLFNVELGGNVFDLVSAEIIQENLSSSQKSIISNAVSINTDSSIYLKLEKNISTDLNFDLKLTFGEGFELTLSVTYTRFINLNSKRSYTLSWDGAKFNDSLNYSDLIPNYKGEIEQSIDYNDNSPSSNETKSVDENSIIKFATQSNEYTATITITLKDILGTPSYTFVITLKPSNMYIDWKSGYDEQSSASTIVSEEGTSALNAIITDNSSELTKFVISNNSGTIATVNLNGDCSVTDLKFKVNNEEKDYIISTIDDIVSYGVIRFVPTATNIKGILVITFNDLHTIEVYITICQSYMILANYRITDNDLVPITSKYNANNISSAWGNELIYNQNGDALQVKPADFEDNYNNYYIKVNKYSSEAFKVGTQLTVGDLFNDIDINELANAYDLTINTKRMSVYALNGMAETNLSSLGLSVDQFTMSVWYDTYDGLVQDETGIYASIKNNTITFVSAGTVYVKLSSDTGLSCYYKVEIQETENYYDNFTFDETKYFRMAGLTDSWAANTYYVNSGTPTKPVYTLLESQNKPADFEINKSNYYLKINNYQSGRYYYSATMEELSVGKNYKLLSLTYSPNQDLFFGMYVTAFNNNESIISGSNNLTISNNGLNGSWTNTAKTITLSYTILDGFDVIVSLQSSEILTNSYFDISLITLNGIAKQIRLYVNSINVSTNTENFLGHTNNINLLADRINITNGSNTKLNFNNGSGYYLVYTGAYNLTDSARYGQGANSLIVVNNTILNSLNYATSIITINGVAYNTEILLTYKIYYNNVLLEEIFYNCIIENDILISMNGFTSSENYSLGKIYLANYKTDDDKTYTEVDLVNKADTSYNRNEYIKYFDKKTQQYLFDGTTSTNVSNYMHFSLVSAYFSNIPTDKVLVQTDGKIKIFTDKEGTIGIKVTAQYTPSYSIILIINIVPSINVIQKYSENDYYAGEDGLTSGKEVTLLTIGDDNAAMFALRTTSYNKNDNSLELKENNLTETYKIGYRYIIRESLSSNYEFVTGNDYTYKDVKVDAISLKINLPYVPISATTSYIVTYQIKFTSRDTERTYICNYLVKNPINLEVSETYKTDKTIKVAEKAQPSGSTNLQIWGEGYDDALLKYEDNEKIKNFIAGSKVGFINIVENGVSLDAVYYFTVKNTANANNEELEVTDASSNDNYYIDLYEHQKIIFSNSITFDLIFVGAGNETLYTITGWTFESSSLITPKNPKALSSIFTTDSNELGSKYADKNFIAVLDKEDNITVKNLGFDDTIVSGDANYSNKKFYKSEKTITRGSATYDIYSVKVRTNSDDSFYSNSAIFYVIVTSQKYLLEIPANHYISKIIELENYTNDPTITIDIGQYFKTLEIKDNWIADTTLSLSVDSITHNYGDDLLGYKNSEITITKDNISQFNMSFNVTVKFGVEDSYSYFTIRVDLTII